MGYVSEMNELVNEEVNQAMKRIGEKSLELLVIKVKDDSPGNSPHPDLEEYKNFFEDIYDIANEYLDAINNMKKTIND